jgi:hypothetical protein
MGGVPKEIQASTSSLACPKKAETERRRKTSNHRGDKTPLGSTSTSEMTLARS